MDDSPRQPPSVDGPGARRWVASAEDAGVRLDKYLAAPQRLGSRARAAAAIDRGKVFVNGTEASLSEASRPIGPGEIVQVWEDRPFSSRRRTAVISGELEVAFEDAAILVVNKPAGLLSVPVANREGARSVVDLLEDYLRSRTRRKPYVVHRIDRDTSGLVVFAKDAHAHAALKAQFRRHEPERIYWAVVYGHPRPPAGMWRDHLVWDTKALIQKQTSPSDPKAAEAIAYYRVLETFAETSLVEVRLHTGKRNQIRIQARLRGHTLVGERRYVYGPQTLRPVAFSRQALHAHRLAFDHPVDRRRLQFEAPLPADLTDLLTHLRRSRRVE